MSGDNALDVNDNGVLSKKRLPFSGGPHTKRTVGNGQDCILGCLLARKFCAGKSIQADPLFSGRHGQLAVQFGRYAPSPLFSAILGFPRVDQANATIRKVAQVTRGKRRSA